jgi:hypothetical protein
MGSYTASRSLKVLGWAATILMALVVAGMFLL